MDSSQVCRICLAHDTPMHAIENKILKEFYTKVTGIPYDLKDGRDTVVCHICRHLLKRCHRFAESAVKADEALQNIFDIHVTMTDHLLTRMREPFLFTALQNSPLTNFNETGDDDVTIVNQDEDPLSMDRTEERERTAGPATGLPEVSSTPALPEIKAEPLTLDLGGTEEDRMSPEEERMCPEDRMSPEGSSSEDKQQSEGDQSSESDDDTPLGRARLEGDTEDTVVIKKERDQEKDPKAVEATESEEMYTPSEWDMDEEEEKYRLLSEDPLQYQEPNHLESDDDVPLENFGPTEGMDATEDANTSTDIDVKAEPRGSMESDEERFSPVVSIGQDHNYCIPDIIYLIPARNEYANKSLKEAGQSSTVSSGVYAGFPGFTLTKEEIESQRRLEQKMSQKLNSEKYIMALCKEEKLKRKRETARRRMEKIKSDPDLYAQGQLKQHEEYEKKKERGAQVPKKRTLQRTTKSPERPEVQTSRGDKVTTNSGTETGGAQVPKKRTLQRTTKSPERPEVQTSSGDKVTGNTKNSGPETNGNNDVKAERSHGEDHNNQPYLETLDCEREYLTHNITLINKKATNPCSNNCKPSERNTITGRQIMLCEYCKKKFTHKTKLTEHLRIHTGEKPYECNYCKKRFTRKSKLTEHVRIHENPFECRYCKKKFTHKHSLNEHVRIHTGEKLFECNYCKKNFTQKHGLINHVRIHTGERPFECSYCKKRFTIKENLIKHVRIHTGEKPFECSYCKKKFIQKQNLIRHVRIHTGEKPFECSYCKKRFTIKENLIKHVRIHTGEKPIECSYCKKRFTIKENLIKHVRTHTGEKPFECSHCKKKFIQKQNLIRHVRIHTGEKPFECSYCKKRFTIKDNLIKHVRIHTGESRSNVITAKRGLHINKN
ncbi:hypothetical protein ABMA28_011273 [Loxostege sticticalis]|uniref:Uncharacterized protein n=1 Tax=Loxostege sticticalis TaxID=481309 RepID=A0ABD0S936_LOXSC